MTGIVYKGIGLEKREEEVISQLLNISAHNPPLVEDIWQLMDNVWDQYGCDNLKLDSEKLRYYYRHPVWTLNGLFIEQDPTSMQHRHAISNWIVKQQKIDSVLDYGGGFGTLARLIGDKKRGIKIDIYEPHPGPPALKALSTYSSIRFISAINRQYDCLISTDVLEHVPDPLGLLNRMIDCVKPYGNLLIANNFYPVIKCHLPATFHLRYSFRVFTKLMGLKYLGPCRDSHAVIYEKKGGRKTNWVLIRFLEKISSHAFPLLETARGYYRIIKNR